MIQRIQTAYLAIPIVLLSIVTFGTSLFTLVGETSLFTFSSYGIVEYGLEDGTLIGQKSYPFYLGTIALALLCFICLMSYKNLERQFKLGRTVFFIYFLMLITVVLLSTFGDALIDVESKGREMGLGFILFVAGFPFTFLANTGIKRDKKLIASLDRLR
jgi:hypothetical protein